MARKPAIFRIPEHERAGVDAIVARFTDLNPDVATLSPRFMSTLRFLIFTTQNRLRLQDWEELIYYSQAESDEHQRVYKTPLDRIQPHAKIRYKLIRFFFATPKGSPQIPPMEIMSRRKYRWTQQRSSVYPYHDMGFGWTSVRQQEEFWQPDTRFPTGGDWTLSPPHVETTVNGRKVIVYGKRLDGEYRYETACNEACTSAVGPQCSCACGGVNHGTGAVVAIWVPRRLAEQKRILIRGTEE